MSETKTNSSDAKPTALSQIIETFKRSTSGEKVTCLNCGAVNPAGEEKCENCGEALERPAPLLINAVETIIRPMRAMRRIAATSPVMQAFLVVVLMVAIYILVGSLVRLFSLQQALNDYPKFLQDFHDELAKLKPEDQPTAVSNFVNNPPVPGLAFVLSNFIFLLISWGFFSLAVYYTARIFYRNDSHATIPSLLSIVGFARITNLASFVFLLPLTTEIGYGLQIALLAWQLVLIVIGTRFSSGLSWNRCAVIVVIPALLFRFFLQIPF
jgi:hypothetical protein